MGETKAAAMAVMARVRSASRARHAGFWRGLGRGIEVWDGWWFFSRDSYEFRYGGDGLFQGVEVGEEVGDLLWGVGVDEAFGHE